MSFLTQELPVSVEVAGIFYKIKPEFKNILRILEMLKDPLLNEQDKGELILLMFYAQEVPQDKCFIDAFFEFINQDKEKADTKGAPVLSYEQDAKEIFTAFYRVYGIDILNTGLHWYKFSNMVQDLGESPNLSVKIEIRGTNIADVPKEKKAKFLQVQNKLKVR